VLTLIRIPLWSNSGTSCWTKQDPPISTSIRDAISGYWDPDDPEATKPEDFVEKFEDLLPEKVIMYLNIGRSLDHIITRGYSDGASFAGSIIARGRAPIVDDPHIRSKMLGQSAERPMPPYGQLRRGDY
jgi:hypothetical protein